MNKTIIEIDEDLSTGDKQRLSYIIDAYTNSCNAKVYTKSEYMDEIYDEMYDLVIKNLKNDAESN